MTLGERRRLSALATPARSGYPCSDVTPRGGPVLHRSFALPALSARCETDAMPGSGHTTVQAFAFARATP